MPGPSDDAVIGLSGVEVTHSSSASDSVNSLTVSQSDATLDLSNGSLAMWAPSSIACTLVIGGGTLSTSGTLTVTDSMDWTGGIISGPGTLAIGSQASLSLAGSVETLSDGAALDNGGAATVSGGNLDLLGGASLVNQSGGSLTLAGNLSINLYVGARVDNQAGATVTVTGSTAIEGDGSSGAAFRRLHRWPGHGHTADRCGPVNLRLECHGQRRIDRLRQRVH